MNWESNIVGILGAIGGLTAIFFSRRKTNSEARLNDAKTEGIEQDMSLKLLNNIIEQQGFWIAELRENLREVRVRLVEVEGRLKEWEDYRRKVEREKDEQ